MSAVEIGQFMHMRAGMYARHMGFHLPFLLPCIKPKPFQGFVSKEIMRLTNGTICVE